MNRRKITLACGLIFALGHWETGHPVVAADPGGGFDIEKLHALIPPGVGESRWMEVDWYPTVWEGWKVAAEEGKPIFFMAGSGGAPCAGC